MLKQGGVTGVTANGERIHNFLVLMEDMQLWANYVANFAIRGSLKVPILVIYSSAMYQQELMEFRACHE